MLKSQDDTLLPADPASSGTCVVTLSECPEANWARSFAAEKLRTVWQAPSAPGGLDRWLDSTPRQPRPLLPALLLT